MASPWIELTLFAQQQQEAAQRPMSFLDLLFPIGISLVFLWFIVLMPDKKRQKQRQQQLDSIKKNDKVVTIGGIYGVVSNVKPGEDEVVLKVDEDKDVKIRVTRSSIAQVLVGKEKPVEGTS
jgi:preprotein translocase subunit YajC